MSDQAIVSGSGQLRVIENAVVPSVIASAGDDAKRRFVEFFAANISNEHTREAYLRAVHFFCRWVEKCGVELHDIEPTHVAVYRELLMKRYADTSVKQHLAGIRMLFDYLVTGGVISINPAAAVKGPRVTITKGKSPVLSAEDTRTLLDSIPLDGIAGLRDRALIGLMVFSFARIGAALAMNVGDVYRNGHRYWVRLHEKGGKYHEMPLHHSAENYLLSYMETAGLFGAKGTPLFRTLDRKRNLTENRMLRQDAWLMIKRRATAAGIGDEICNHTFRATGITEYLRNGGTLEKAQQMAAHSSSGTTNLYNRVEEEMSLTEVERVRI